MGLCEIWGITVFLYSDFYPVWPVYFDDGTTIAVKHKGIMMIVEVDEATKIKYPMLYEALTT